MHECFSTEDEFHYPEEDDDEDDDEDYGEDENVSRARGRGTSEDEYNEDQPGYMQQDSCQEEYVEDAVEEISLEPPQLFQMNKMKAILFLQVRVYFKLHKLIYTCDINFTLCSLQEKPRNSYLVRRDPQSRVFISQVCYNRIKLVAFTHFSSD